MAETRQGPLEKISEYCWRIPASYKPGMRVPGIIYTDEKLLKDILRDKAVDQVANVAFLPGIVNASFAMPDIHWGFGFCIGGVAATDIEAGGVISPGGVGFDINCGVRLLKTNFQYNDIKDKIRDLISALFSSVPAGLGSKGDIKVSEKEERKLLVKGAKWAVENGYGVARDLECTEEYGAIEGADPSAVSKRAYERGKAQSGTLGSGNHFLEIQVIDQLYDKTLCDKFGLDLGLVTIMIHSGSRGLGYQVCDDYAKSMIHCLQKYNINVPDRQLACAPVTSPEGHAYLSAMKCAANYAWANRQCLMHLTRKTFEKVFGMSWHKMGMHLIYDVSHNIARIEDHCVEGRNKKLCVHRKGATRAFPDQPVIIPGDMGTNSYLLVGTQKAMEETFGSTSHGAGRVKSRTAAAKSVDLNTLLKELDSKGIIVKASGRRTLVEEAPEAYKDINEVIDVVHNAGISKRVCRMRPIGVIKG